MKQRILTLLVAVVMAFAVVAQVPTTEQATVKVTHLTKAEFLAKVKEGDFEGAYQVIYKSFLFHLHRFDYSIILL